MINARAHINLRILLIRYSLIVLLAGFLPAHPLLAQVGDTVIVAPPDTMDTGTADQAEETTVDTEFLSEKDTDRLPDTIVLRTVPDSVAAALRNRKEFAYANDPAYWTKEEPEKPGGFWYWVSRYLQTVAGKTVLIIVLGSVLLYILYQIVVSNNLSLFYRSGRRPAPEEETAFTEIDDDELDSKLSHAEAIGDWRSAVRFQYLRTLRFLNEKGWITYNSQNTNYDYLLQLGQLPIAEDFAFVTRVYEYVWYGELPISPLQYESVKERFDILFKSGKV